MATALLVGQATSGPKGSVEQEFETPSVLAILAVIAVLEIAAILGIAEYWHLIAEAKKLHPDSIGYGKWYFSLIPRIWVTVVAGVIIIALLAISLFFVYAMPGPQLAGLYFQGKQQEREQGIVQKEENTLLTLEANRVNQLQNQ